MPDENKPKDGKKRPANDSRNSRFIGDTLQEEYEGLITIKTPPTKPRKPRES